MKYLGINTVLRKQMQNLWNRPRRWPIYAALIALSFFAFFALRGQNKPLHVSNKSNDVRHGLLSRTLPVKPVTDNTMENTAQ
jgi:hypothetical protein